MVSHGEGEVAKGPAGSPSLSATTSYFGLADTLLALLPRFRHDQRGEIRAFSFDFFLAQPSEVFLCSTHWCFGLLVLPAKLCTIMTILPPSGPLNGGRASIIIERVT